MSFGVFTGAKHDSGILEDELAIFDYKYKNYLIFLVESKQTNINIDAILFKELPHHYFPIQTRSWTRIQIRSNYYYLTALYD